MNALLITPYQGDINPLELLIQSYLNCKKNVHLKTEFKLCIIFNLCEIKICEYFESKYTQSDILFIQYNKKPSSYAARNVGIKSYDCDYYFFVDGDVQLKSNYLIEAEKIIKREDPVGSGKVEFFSAQGKNSYSIFDQCIYMQQQKYTNAGYCATANCYVKKQIFEKYGYFQEIKSGGDGEFFGRLKNKVQIIHNHSLVVKHPTRDNFFEHKKKLSRMSEGHIDIAVLKKDSLTKLFIKNAFGILIMHPGVVNLREIYDKEKFLNIKIVLVCFLLSTYLRSVMCWRILSYVWNKRCN
ncbi:hypothetical protein N8668_00795 [bacterium]|nr:hypothetical protein [bacterium]MDA7660295.1 hypothetical protein [Verrucomicrobiota bacterium]